MISASLNHHGGHFDPDGSGLNDRGIFQCILTLVST